MKTVLVIGSGGREHALCWKAAESPSVGAVIAAPGNAGFERAWGGALLRKLHRWSDVNPGDPSTYPELARRAREVGVDLVIVGPDDPLAAGIVDVFAKEGVLAFGPTAGAARIESSKAFAKEVMHAAGVPTADFHVVGSREEALRKITELDWTEGRGWVIKADGLALGKGVVVCDRLEEARAAIDALPAGRLVIEEKLVGHEVSWLAFCDGERAALLDPARDFKRLGEGDQGPNTGGMGAFSPVPGLAPGLEEEVRSRVFLPVLAEMGKRGHPFRGVLYAGLMVRDSQFWVLEFNARFGDPETQVLLPRMRGDLVEWCEAAARGRLDMMPERVPFAERERAVVVVAASKGYPGKPEVGRPIAGGMVPAGVFFAGVRERAGEGAGGGAEALGGPSLVTSGGRVLGTLGMGPSFVLARRDAYDRMAGLRFEGAIVRGDIAQAVAREEVR